MKTGLTKSTLIFVALAIAGVCLVVFGQAAADSAVGAVLLLLGTAILSPGLTYFLIKVG